MQGIKLSVKVPFVTFEWLVEELPAAKARICFSLFCFTERGHNMDHLASNSTTTVAAAEAGFTLASPWSNLRPRTVYIVYRLTPSQNFVSTRNMMLKHSINISLFF